MPGDILDNSMIACLEAGYFPDQASAGLMTFHKGEWTHHATEALHSLVLAHAGLPWLGLGHSQGFQKLIELSVRWHRLFSLHGFTRFTSGPDFQEGTPPRVMSRMVQKAEQNLPLVLQDFHERCGHVPHWARLDEQSLLHDLRSLQALNCTSALQHTMAHGTELHAWSSMRDRIVSLEMADACFGKALSAQGRELHKVDAEHAGFADRPALYTGSLLHLLHPA
ncbi:MAG TPA: hypothetical protein VFV28_10030 [Limnobacter sp.]|nr:hypothetical protein [Limnobacter sp.]